MRRTLPTVAACAALTLTLPSAALAHHRHGRHHARAHHARVHFEHFGAASTTTTSPTTTPPAGTPRTTTSPTTPTSTPENAGTVASYTGGVLTLTLSDGSTVKGNVTDDTQIECVKATSTTSTGQTSDEDSQDNNDQGDDQSGDGMGQPDDQQFMDSESSQQGDDGMDSDDVGSGTPEPPCDTSALTANAVVRAAELRIGPSGSEFESIELVR